jgi:hypothetical protein
VPPGKVHAVPATVGPPLPGVGASTWEERLAAVHFGDDSVLDWRRCKTRAILGWRGSGASPGGGVQASVGDRLGEVMLWRRDQGLPAVGHGCSACAVAMLVGQLREQVDGVVAAWLQ